MKRITNPVMSLALVALVLSTLLLSACNTTKGAGEDISAAGNGIQNSANRNGAK